MRYNMLIFQLAFSITIIVLCPYYASKFVTALDNGLARTPPMGWLAWERYVCETDCRSYPGECIDFQLFHDMAERIVSDGFKQAGYEYINIDDCWSTRQRNVATRALMADPFRFPLSIKPLADRVHSFGLKLGIYGDCGTETCQGFPGQLKYSSNLTENYYDIDAETFAAWEIDSFKFDGCYLNVSRASSLCPQMGLALNKTGRPMLFSCSWPAYENDENLPTDWKLVAERCNLWRAFGDIEDSWKSVLDTIDWFVKKQDIIVKYHGPGHWFDADQLVIGDFGLSHTEEQAHMAIWCIWASPLYMSNDLRTLSKESSKILKNKYAIAVNQDRLGIFGLMVQEARRLQVFIKPTEPIDSDLCPSYAIVYLDRRTLGNSRIARFNLRKLIVNVHEKLEKASEEWKQWSHCSERNTTSFTVHDLFDNNSEIYTKLTLSQDDLKLRVDPSGARMVQLISNNELDL